MQHIWLAVLLLGTSAMAQQAPRVVNAQLRTEPAGTALAATVSRLEHTGGPQWLGYEVAAVPAPRFAVCSGNAQPSLDSECCGVYRLEGPDTRFSASGAQAMQTRLDLLARIDQGMIDRIVFVDASCQVDAGGLGLTWLTGIPADESLAWLSSLVTSGDRRLTDEALAAIAAHDAQQATAALSGFASASNPAWLREKAAFWLGAERGHDGLLALERLTHDGDPDLRRKLTFDLSTSQDPAAALDLIRIAKSDPDTRVREQAIFWVAQKASAKVVAGLREVAANDPDLAVKKKAVFALSRLPVDQAVPELVHVAQTNPDRVVRKEAIFWLGQTHDPRALAYLATILEH